MPVMIIPNPTLGVNVLNFPSPQAVSGTVSVSNFPPTQITSATVQGLSNQLQRISDLLESSIVESRVISLAIAQLNDGSNIDPEELRSDIDLAMP